MARADAEDSANSQFYIMLAPKFALDSHYTVWGRVISGMQYVDMLAKGEPPAKPSKILQASIVADHVPPKLPAPETVPAPIAAAPPSITTTTQTKTVTQSPKR